MIFGLPLFSRSIVALVAGWLACVAFFPLPGRDVLAGGAESQARADWLVRDGKPAACIVLGDKPNPVMKKAAGILNRNLAVRTGVELPTVSDPGASSVAILVGQLGNVLPFGLQLQPAPYASAPGRDGILLRTLARGDKQYISVYGANPRSVIYAVGKFLRGLNFAGKDVSSPRWDLEQSPQCEMRGFWFANHAPDVGYEMMTGPQFRTYLEDILLWGVNTFAYAPIDFHNWDSSTFYDPTKFQRDMRRNFEEIPGIVGQYDLKIVVKMFNNNVFSDDTAKLGLRKNLKASDATITKMMFPPGNFVCPNHPASRRRLLETREELFKRLPRVDVLVAHATDSGGCACPDCQPYAATYVKLMDEYGRLLRKYHPQAKIGINFYHFTEKGKQIALDYVAGPGRDQVGYVYYGLHPAAEPADLRRLPPGVKAYTFYDVAMWPFWGVYGAMPLVSPLTQERSLAREPAIAAEPNYAGAIPYSEGLHEDLTRAVYSDWLWDHRADPQNTIREYCRFYFGCGDDDVIELIRRMDRTGPMYYGWKSLFTGLGAKPSPSRQAMLRERAESLRQFKPDATATWNLTGKIQSRLPPWAVEGWRWKSMRVRALCDYVLTHYQAISPTQRRTIRDEVLRLGRDIYAQSSWGILGSKRDISRIAENYDQMIPRRLDEIYKSRRTR